MTGVHHLACGVHAPVLPPIVSELERVRGELATALHDLHVLGRMLDASLTESPTEVTVLKLLCGMLAGELTPQRLEEAQALALRVLSQ